LRESMKARERRKEMNAMGVMKSLTTALSLGASGGGRERITGGDLAGGGMFLTTPSQSSTKDDA